MSAETTLTKTFEFSSSHRYFRAEWTQEENERVFGACARPNGHGHNYLLDVTVKGPVDPVTGMVINIVDVKAVVEDVLEEFDHHHLNYDMPYFEDRVPDDGEPGGHAVGADRAAPSRGVGPRRRPAA